MGEFRLTKWHNPLATPQTFEVSGQRFTFKPGETREIPSECDRFIHRTEAKSNVILGGLAPQMVNLSLPEDQRGVLHEALDAGGMAVKEAAEHLALAQAAKDNAEAAQMVAASKLVDAAKSTQSQARK